MCNANIAHYYSLVLVVHNFCLSVNKNTRSGTLLWVEGKGKVL